MTIQVTIKNGVELARLFHQAPALVSEEMTRAVWESSLLLERETKENTPVGIGGGGGLRGSISARQPRPSSEGIIGKIGTPLNYAVAVELGSRPHMPPVQPLIDWARHKLGLGGGEAKRAGFAIARKISRKGTPAAKMFEQAFEQQDSAVQRIFERALHRIQAHMGTQA